MHFKITKLVAILLLVAGCGSTQTYHKVTTEQANDAWHPHAIETIVVIADTEDRGERVGSETVFADHLRSRGMNAIASYEFLPNLGSIDTSQEAKDAFASRNIDAVISIGVAKPASGYERSTYWEARGLAVMLGSDNSRAWGDLADLDDYYTQGEHSLDIGLWDAKSMQPIWHAQTDSNEWDAGSGGVARLAEAVAEMLVQRGYIRP